ncbi:MAG: DoxX family protein [Candidatus Krumholzibacteriia bacterium]
MTLRKILAVPDRPLPVDLALLLLRLVVGVAFMFHGWIKIRHPTGWMGPQATVPGFFQVLAAISEFGGGLAWVLGLLTPPAAFGIACTMSYAIHLQAVTLGNPFVSKTGGPSYELAAVFLAVALLLIVGGPGRASLDRLLFGRR